MRVLLIAALLPLIAGCEAKWEKDGQAIKPSGQHAKRSYAVSGFTGVELRGPDDVDVRNGPNFSVVAEGDSKILDEVEIKLVDGRLRVGRKEHKGRWFSHDDGVRVHVVMPRVESASVAGSGDLSIERAEGSFKGAIAGSGDLKVQSLTATDADLSIAGSGDMTVIGTADKLSAAIIGSGDIDAGALTAKGASISITGSGSMRGTVSGGASISIAGSGDVELSGGAKCSVSSVGSGEARCS